MSALFVAEGDSKQIREHDLQVAPSISATFCRFASSASSFCRLSFHLVCFSYVSEPRDEDAISAYVLGIQIRDNEGKD